MGFGKVGFAQAGNAAAPSESIWGDCPNTLLRDLGLGYFAHEEFLGASTGTLAAALDVNQWSAGGNFKLDADTDTVLTQKAAEQGGYLDIETDGDDNDAAAVFSQVLGKIVRNSGNKLWFEARFEVGAVADQGVFIGIAEEAALSRDILADDVATSGASGLIDESVIGFVIAADDTNGLDIVYSKDAGTPVAVLNDATTSTSYTDGGGTSAAIVADTERKVGIYFNGRTTLAFFVDGIKVAEQDVDSTVDQDKNYGAIIAVKTGTGAAVSIAVDWVRVAAQVR